MRTQYTTHMAPKESDIGSVFDACVSCYFLFFFFQAEDGIRDHCVTGVQTCALPISWRFLMMRVARPVTQQWKTKIESACKRYFATLAGRQRPTRIIKNLHVEPVLQQHVAAGSGVSNRDWRSEERRVGKEGRSGGTR